VNEYIELGIVQVPVRKARELLEYLEYVQSTYPESDDDEVERHFYTLSRKDIATLVGWGNIALGLKKGARGV
jgi:hypothetical protein